MNTLSEKDFIQEKKGGSPWKIWLGMLILTGAFLFLIFSVDWTVRQTQRHIEQSPFLRVNNREFSLFLWQYTDYMRPHIKKRTGYLPGFHLIPKVTPKPDQVDEWAIAPPEILFRYHVWDRLLSGSFSPREISSSEFRKFLAYAEEWQPRYWKEASQAYSTLITDLEITDIEDLEKKLPIEVQRAFIGWKNYFEEGDAINDSTYTVAEVSAFLQHYPHYSRSYWRNLYPDYLQSLEKATDSQALVPKEEFPSFLRLALYNYYQS